MSGLKKKLKAHATTCIKAAIIERIKSGPNHQLAYQAFCDRKDCWSDDELISGYMCAVNLTQTGYTLGRPIQRTLADKSVLCGNRSVLSLRLEVFASGCDATVDTALSVLADVTQRLVSCDAPSTLLVKRLLERSSTIDTDSEFSEEKSRVVTDFEAEFDYFPCRPSVVFNRYGED